MVATSAWALRDDTQTGGRACRHGKERQGHGALLRHLLAKHDGGLAWIGADRDGVVDYLPSGPGADELIRKLERDVDRECTQARKRVDRSLDDHRRQLGMLRHRIVLNSEQLAAVTDPEAVPDHPGALRSSLPDESTNTPYEHLVALDLRFDFYLDKPLCHLSMSIWSARPLNKRYYPSTSGAEWPRDIKPQRIPIGDVERYADRFHRILRETIELLDCFLSEAELRAYQRKHVLPIFWVPVPKARQPQAVDYRNNLPALRRQLAYTLLGLRDPADCAGAGSIVEGEFDVLRRYRRGRSPDPEEFHHKHLRLSRAHYLIIPARPVDAMSPDLEKRKAEYQHQEARTARIIESLTDVEAHGGSYLHDVHRGLQILGSHLSIYDKVAERAAVLWDGVSNHLVSQRRISRRLRHSVELMHQILLQGVGDLAELANRTSEFVTRVETATDQLYADFDDQLTESHLGTDGLRAAIVRAGLLEKVSTHAKRTQQEANRIKTIYDDLLRTLGYAFDEWRVRESDVIQRLSGGLGFFLASIGLVTVLDATFNLKSATGVTIFGGRPWLADAGVLASWGVGGVLFAVISGMGIAWLRSGRLGTHRFRSWYKGRLRVLRRDGLWRLINDVSTDRIHALAGVYERKGRSLDDTLALRFAKVWDSTATWGTVGRRGGARRDAKVHAAQIERWGLRALLLTERSRLLHRYPLPKLACLYRCCPRLPGSFLGGPAQPYPPDPTLRTNPLTADLSEFALSMDRIGLSWDQAADLDRWLINRQPKTAADVLALADKAGLAETVDVAALLKTICPQLNPEPEPAAGSGVTPGVP